MDGYQAAYRRLVFLASSREGAGLLRNGHGNYSFTYETILFPCGVNERSLNLPVWQAFTFVPCDMYVAESRVVISYIKTYVKIYRPKSSIHPAKHCSHI